ncbi:tetratricopeptide repeat protein [Haloflavibacter putidus]|uniref:Tetratricopeptide repeat protein n=1 Tax=Haloflavibacter putidus TaxID=2576776 RepID=A0A507ZID8_9FLAO|nr:tetratricopeptide repeat protein [Haloflavibacter putidus]TQD36939.1 tetratricopeptide repeat protein [Haloflavibacter putidus]
MRFSLLYIALFFLCGNLFAQSPQLADNYMDQGEYEKAKSIYQKLLEKAPNNLRYMQQLTKVYQELEQYQLAEKLLLKNEDQANFYPNLLVEIGYNYQLMQKPEKAADFYEQAIDKVKTKPNYTYVIGNAFQDYNLLDEAVEVYEIGLKNAPNTNFTVQLARIYGEQGKLAKMFETYTDLIEEKPEYFYSVNRNFSQYITEDVDNEANVELRKLLLRKNQQQPKVLYNELLAWLFTQQNDFKKAFIQQKAIFMRSEKKQLHPFFDLAEITTKNKQTELSKDILEYVIENSNRERQQLNAHLKLLQLAITKAEPEDYKDITKDFENLLEDYGRATNTLGLQLAFAEFLAFTKKEPARAKNILQALLNQNLNRFEEGRIKLLLADILVFQEQFNQALIYYSQIQKKIKNTNLAQEARFRVARTSYYKGDFDWAQTQLKVLKSSSSQLIANDALELHLLISDNSQEDSTQTALKLFAKADLYAFQQENKKAKTFLDSILSQHKGEKIEDEALYRKAKILEKEKRYQEAAESYQKIIRYYGDDILADDAHFYLAELYQYQLNQPEEAKKHYQNIIFDFADSIHFVEARKQFRKLRGDAIQ